MEISKPPASQAFGGTCFDGLFIVAGILAALAGLLQAGRIASILSSFGQNLIFNAFAAAVLGGVSLNGGLRHDRRCVWRCSAARSHSGCMYASGEGRRLGCLSVKSVWLPIPRE
ncbi:hypothetical protein GR211_32435 [Rhizobium leguminosarum]|nr:hypothetical protein [Rhizobium ruizarguesonis]NEK31551.1 hypothetical protein [Rhizobium ruizarguesonis]